jgi:alpha-tubulin suppressor-like RCC1 family protein
VNAAGSLLVWGSDESLLLGLGSDRANKYIVSPTSLSISIRLAFSTVACGYEHTLALSEDGRVFSWGNALMGRLGHGRDVDAWEPTLISSLGGEATAAVVEVARSASVATIHR